MKTGHAKNVESFEKLLGICTGFGAAYAPSKTSIKLVAINTVLASAQQSLQQVKVAQNAFDNSSNNRESSITALRKLASRIISALEATDATRQTVEDGKSIVRKITGSNYYILREPVPSGATGETEMVVSKSRSQRDAYSMVDNFAKLLQAVTAEANYKPAETDLQVVTLGTTLTVFRDRNKSVNQAELNLQNARIARNKVMYTDANSMHASAMAIKKYVKSVFGLGSEQYSQVAKVSFTKTVK
jgi:hypothetical protein